MKLASFQIAGRSSYGAVVGDGIVDLGMRLKHPTLRALIEAGAFAEAAQAVRGASADHPLAAVTLTVPMPDAPKIILVGRNYKGHVAEAGQKLPAHPSVFIRTHDSFAAPGAPLVRPQVSGHFDYEGELTLVIGKRGRHIPRTRALEHIAGYTILNDGSIRDFQFEHSLTVGKNFERSGSWGPWITTADEIPDPTQLDLATRLNGQQVQHTKTDDLIFDIPFLIEYLSTVTTLGPGDVIATGTPEGVGFARKPPLWMKAGDVCEIEISKIGVLRNPVIAE